MYKLDKTISQTKTFREAEEGNKFAADVSPGERLNQGWYLTAMAYGIDPYDPPLMEKRLFFLGKKEVDAKHI